MMRAASSSFMSSRMKISICRAQSGTSGAVVCRCDRRGVAARERQVAQAVLGEQRGVREPGPAPVRVAQELPGRRTRASRGCAPRSGCLGVDARGGEQRILAARIEREQRRAASRCSARRSRACREVEGLQVEHAGARAASASPKLASRSACAPGGGGSARPARAAGPSAACQRELRGEAGREREPQPARDRGDRTRVALRRCAGGSRTGPPRRAAARRAARPPSAARIRPAARARRTAAIRCASRASSRGSRKRDRVDRAAREPARRSDSSASGRPAIAWIAHRAREQVEAGGRGDRARPGCASVMAKNSAAAATSAASQASDSAPERDRAGRRPGEQRQREQRRRAPRRRRRSRRAGRGSAWCATAAATA